VLNPDPIRTQDLSIHPPNPDPAVTADLSRPVNSVDPNVTETHISRSHGANGSADGGQAGSLVPAIPGYEIEGVLGRGGMGVVCRARNTRLNRTVALKMILGRPGSVELMRFRAEAEAMAAVRHPHVAQVYEVGEADGRPFLTMELLAGGTLADNFTAKRDRSPAAHADIVRKVVTGVAAAHAQGIVHRDLKPGNVLLDESGEPKVTDFGLAKRDAGTDLTATGAVMGTPAYMAPEQADGNTKFVGPSADVWSLGVILYEALTGSRPFTATDTRAVLAQVLTADPVPPRNLVPSIPRDLELICLKCLAKAPHERYPTAAELADDLERYSRGEPISVRPLGRADRAVRWIRRHPAEAGLLAAVAVAVLALAGVGIALVYQDKLEIANGELTIARDQLQNANSGLVLTNKELAEAKTKLEGTQAKLAQALQREQKSRSFNRVTLAFTEWQKNDPARARQYLGECPAEFRGWEWNYVNRLLSPLQAGIKTGHTGLVGPLAVSPDGKTLATGMPGKEVKLFDLATGEEKRVLRGHTAGIYGIVFSRDGKLLATASGDKSVKVWDLATGKNMCTLSGHKNSVHSVTFNGDGTRIATGDDNKVRVWDPVSGKPVFVADANCGGSVRAMTFDPAGTHLFIGNTAINVLDLSKPENGAGNGHAGGDFIQSMAFPPGGENRLVVARYSGIVQFWDMQSWDLRGPRKPPLIVKAHSAALERLEFSPDGKRFGTTSLDGTAKVWDVTTFQELASARVPVEKDMKFMPPTAFTPELYRVAAAHTDGTVKLWPLTDDPAAAVYLRTGTISHATFNADGTHIAASVPVEVVQRGFVYGVTGWDTETGRLVLTIKDEDGKEPGFWKKGAITGVAFSPSGDRVATAHPLEYDANPPEFPPDPAKYTVSAVKVWDAATGKLLLTLKGHTADVITVAYTADGARIVSASQDGTVRVWNAGDGKPIATYTVVTRPPEYKARNRAEWPPSVTPVFALAAFSRDGRRFAGACMDGTVRVWDLAPGKEIATFKAHEKYATALAFTPDGRRVLTGGDDRVVKVWEDGRLIRAYDGHTAGITAAALAPDGTRLASGDASGVVKLWDADTGQEAFSAKADTEIKLLQFHPDGTRLMIAGNATLKVWDARGETEPKR
jgi:WD40 repeat protein/tRNA A-37 threonylcarbamoyl transferase component Bud32